MATKAAIKKFLKDNNLTEEYLDQCWKEGYEYSRVIKSLTNGNMDWRSLDLTAIKTLSTLPEKIKAKKEKLD